LRREIGGAAAGLHYVLGCDYPVLKFELMVEHCRGPGLSEEVLEKMFWRNAERYIPRGRALRAVAGELESVGIAGQR
jgi:hypothetical protein